VKRWTREGRRWRPSLIRLTPPEENGRRSIWGNFLGPCSTLAAVRSVVNSINSMDLFRRLWLLTDILVSMHNSGVGGSANSRGKILPDCVGEYLTRDVCSDRHLPSAAEYVSLRPTSYDYPPAQCVALFPVSVISIQKNSGLGTTAIKSMLPNS
jgi:hypothetical protein